ncbi:MAG: hypothetical protein ACK5JT_10155 [Hyphomicrobiaceae bacterium]
MLFSLTDRTGLKACSCAGAAHTPGRRRGLSVFTVGRSAMVQFRESLNWSMLFSLTDRAGLKTWFCAGAAPAA